MKQLSVWSSCLALILGLQLPGFAQVDFLLDYKNYFVPEESPYLEFYLSVDGSSIFYQADEEGLLQGEIEITYILSQNDSIVNFKKFRLITPKYKEGDATADLIDKKQIILDNGTYDFEIDVLDINSGQHTGTKAKLDPLNFNTEELLFSDALINNGFRPQGEKASFEKAGLYFEPVFRNFISKRDSIIGFYAELYNSSNILGEDEAFLVDFSIVDEVTKKVMNNSRSFKRLTATATLPIADQFSVKTLPSGNYLLQFNVRNKNNEILKSMEVPFQRSNPNLLALDVVSVENSFVHDISNVEEMKEYIRCLQPISDHAELQFAKNQLEYAQLDMMQRYFLNFWKTRDPENPEEAWISYKEEVDLADKEFGYGGVKGYQTERGRVYLQYGKPNTVRTMRYETDTYPYSVWQYYKLNGLTNRRFIFYSPSMGMLGYQVLHSNVPGEVQNPNWEFELQRKTDNARPTQENPYDENINDRAKDLFNNPR